MDFADKRPPPKTTAQAFELAFDPDGDNVFVLSALFPQAFGRKLKKKEEKPQEDDDDGTEQVAPPPKKKPSLTDANVKKEPEEKKRHQ